MFKITDYKEVKYENYTIIVRSDGANIPVCEGNADYQEYLRIKEGADSEV